MLEWIAGILIVVALLGMGAWLLRCYLPSGAVTEAIFGQRPERRIGVSETVNVDGRRKLMLIYRDGVEHLIMTGGPIDMVLEQNIQPPRRSGGYEARPVSTVENGDASAQPSFGRARQRPPAPVES
jgi:flagellar protein FliO/FliZ